jgi:hypothetical protein
MRTLLGLLLLWLSMTWVTMLCGVYMSCLYISESAVFTKIGFSWFFHGSSQSCLLCTDKGHPWHANAGTEGRRCRSMWFPTQHYKEVVGQHLSPAALPPGKDAIPIIQEADLGSGPVWTAQKISLPPPGFDPQTIQPIVNYYTDCTILAVTFLYPYNLFPLCLLLDYEDGSYSVL